MILLLDTSTAVCELSLVGDDGVIRNYSWEAGHQLSVGLLGFMRDCLAKQSATWNDLSGLGVMRGHGSFTGLRIGMTVMNTLADALNISIVGVKGDNWRDLALQRLKSNDNDRLVLPDYGSPAHITQPRK